MKLKLDEAGHAVVQDGKPVYVHDDGKEIAFDAPATVGTISRLTEESKGFKTRAQEAEGKLKGFEGIEDPAAAKAALETIKNIDEGKLLSAGKVEEIKNAAKRAAEEQVAAANKATAEQLAEKDKQLETLNGQLKSHMIGGNFKGSKFIAEKVAIPPDMVESRFGQNFRVEDGKVIAYDGSGNKIFSRSKPGEVAEFDEALETLVEQYPYKDQILKGNNAGGSGAPANGGGQGGAKRGDFGGDLKDVTAAIASKFPELPAS